MILDFRFFLQNSYFLISRYIVLSLLFLLLQVATIVTPLIPVGIVLVKGVSGPHTF